MMVNFARQGKLWWTLVAILTRKLFVKFGSLRRKTNRTIKWRATENSTW